MTGRGARWLSAGLLAGVGLLEIPSTMNPAVSFADDTALIMGYAETPTPMQSYVDQVMSLFIDPSKPLFDGQPTYDGYSPLVVTTEEGADYQQVMAAGSAQLDAAIGKALTGPDDHVVVWGYSESSAIATQELVNLGDAGKFNPDQLQFVLLEDLNNPNGGFLERFPDLAGTPFPATPASTPYDVAIYSVQYSGSSDFPQFSSNLLADENAMAGFVNLHPLLLPGYPSSFDFSSLGNAVLEPVSNPNLTTDYYLIPTQNLPLLDFGRDLGGNTFADLIQPDMRVLIDLGYDYTGNADVVTAASMGTPDFDTTAVDAYLLAGANQGIMAALVDVGVLQKSDLLDLYPYVPDVQSLFDGALSSHDPASVALATADATASANALVDALTASDNPLASTLLTFLPGFANDLAGLFGNFLPSL
ncbi:PE-PPE domain-containing protein [Candidatus Mycobacterium wuenschmannii]|uniref:PE-PPE domain-containing protein n=1 Tax=Candidatus Mycobacterium wuenschmannii TaxID=3027808 RepID=A0ABY8W1V9_9MYCO|nr:PE-PPE domain-containing protein [Candidatus Mycobacterium wuenschmannii]WIM89855.1 PE-PPE domain-containing protein [Candidatus Mycobacterium wuenschmannii]